MKKVFFGLLFIALIPAPALSCMAFFKYDTGSKGMSKICIYDHLGDDYAITVKSYEICPVTVEAPH